MSDNSSVRTVSFDVSEKNDGITAGELLKRGGVSRRLITALKREEDGITLDGKQIRTIDAVHAGERVIIRLKDDNDNLRANPLLFVPIAYEDEDVVVFDKPPDMPVHPSIRHHGDTLGNYFAAVYPNLAFRPINRLDKDTSGLCAVAKNAHAAAALQGRLDKTYFAVVCGCLTGEGKIDEPIGRADGSVIKREVRADGQRSVTEYAVLSGNDKYTLLRIKLLTGRTHQIRVHFSHLGYALAGDDFYGGYCGDIKRQALHCGELTFISPVSKKEVKLYSELPTDIKSIAEF